MCRTIASYARAYISVIQTGCPAPSTPPPPDARKRLIFNGYFRAFGCRGGKSPHTPICTLGVGRVLGYLIPNTQKRHKYILKIRYLRAQGVRGVEGVGHSACMTTIYTHERFSPQVQLDLQSSWSEYKDLQSD